MYEAESTYNVIRWSMSLGVNAGYDLTDQKKMKIEDICAIYQDVAKEVFEDTGVYISAVCNDARIVYHIEWGCPKGGEFAYTFTGSCNPFFSEKEKYTQALQMVAKLMKEKLHQSTVLLEIVPAHIEYFKD